MGIGATSEIINITPELGNIGDIVFALGVFDGVHMGHRKLISDCCEYAKEAGAKSAIMTFDVDPEEIFGDASTRKLLSNEDRISVLSRLGADMVLVLKFDEQFSQESPQMFLDTAIRTHMNPLGVYVGCNFRFGHRASGDARFLKKALGDACNVVDEELLCHNGEPVTATRIRDLIENGKLDAANHMLNRMHSMRTRVVKGRQVGRTIGYPTANLVGLHDYVKPCDGVYAGFIVVEGECYRTSISVGVPKTFGDIEWTIEAHIIDFDKDIYGEDVTVYFAEYLRPMIKFDSTDALVAQIAADTEHAASLPMPEADELL
ncbi:MAG: riboflavin biosynthesis protein RibF [Coriobacteriales bacterium]|jgi:riboflavin kinase/FMN adenylyltransferase